MSYVTGFTILQESVDDELRGRTFATLYTVIRLCLLLTLVVSPLWADFWEWFVGLLTAGHSVSASAARATRSPVYGSRSGVGGLMTHRQRVVGASLGAARRACAGASRAATPPADAA